jgi:hypothetical protein
MRGGSTSRPRATSSSAPRPVSTAAYAPRVPIVYPRGRTPPAQREPPRPLDLGESFSPTPPNGPDETTDQKVGSAPNPAQREGDSGTRTVTSGSSPGAELHPPSARSAATRRGESLKVATRVRIPLGVASHENPAARPRIGSGAFFVLDASAASCQIRARRAPAAPGPLHPTRHRCRHPARPSPGRSRPPARPRSPGPDRRSRAGTSAPHGCWRDPCAASAPSCSTPAPPTCSPCAASRGTAAPRHPPPSSPGATPD